jgi:hypothetical protein
MPAMPVYYSYPTRRDMPIQGWKISVLSAGLIAIMVFSAVVIVSYVRRDREPTTQRWFRSKSQIGRPLALSQVFNTEELGGLGWFSRKSQIEKPPPAQAQVFEKAELPGNPTLGGGRVFERAELPGNPSLSGGKAGKVLGF